MTIALTLSFTALFLGMTTGLGNVPIGGSCNTSYDCVAPDRSICIGILGINYCYCKNEYIASNDKLDCLTIKDELGAACLEPQQCQAGSLGNLTDCYLNMCWCSEAAIPDPERTKCLAKAVEVGDSCEIQDQCTATIEFSQCTSGTCSCNSGYIPSPDNRKCIPGMALNDPCENVDDCSHIPNASCQPHVGSPSGKTCQCDVAYVGFENQCLEIVEEINKPCSHNIQCSSGLGPASQCANGVCQCQPGYGYLNGGCHFPAALGEMCYAEEECIVGINVYATCAFSGDGRQRCRCKPGAVEFNGLCQPAQ